MRALPLLLLTLLAACGPTESTPRATARQAQPIIGGTTWTGDPNVFMLFIEANNGQGSICTATLIDTRTLLTAAHCVDPRILGATSATIYATNASTERGAVPGVNMWQVAETRTHPDWNPNTLDGDVALALLPRAMTVTPKPWSGLSLETYVGRAVRVVGYGTNTTQGGPNDPMGSGIKRVVDLTLRDLDDRNFYLGNQVDKGICHGDSGGPTFMTFEDGVERLIGVHSYTLNASCLDGADQRLDTNLPFIQQWLKEKEAASCNEDGRCAVGCAYADVDCVCARDGACTLDCPDVRKDPDCPVNCRADGICSAGTCPQPDPDCTVERFPCTAAEQCQSRKCVGDVMHSPYCTAACTSDTQCAKDMRCDVAQGACTFPVIDQVPPGAQCTIGVNACYGGAVCTGPAAGATWCAPNCRSTADCPRGQACEPGYDGQLHCHLPVLTVAQAVQEGPVAPGCSSTGALTPAGLLALALLLRRRP